MKNWTEILTQAGQTKLAAYYEKAADSVKAKLAAQFEQIDFEEMPTLIRDYVLKKPETAIPADLSPAPFYPFPAADDAQKDLFAKAEALGKTTDEIISRWTFKS